ncbi:homeobox-leucine zipper HAT3-like [Olea europaea subsp. europaea]|uniref:Homeobox-leucine zipper HAT3-like n=1 Tax=Olea europaea subsp. europaea TaxID=158383 RepID=A0A8S0PHP9_OLEEU|nr:homeobox-leucine zipper HAT3-like [Olea europaea subsp. europaea]
MASSTVSSVSGKRIEREENDGKRATSSLEEDDGGDAAGRKKLLLSKEQAMVLEETFEEYNTLSLVSGILLNISISRKQKLALAKELNLRPRRLQKEVNDLRTLKLSPHFYMNTNPLNTLTMCPQCERVAILSSSSSATHLPNPIAAHHQRPMPMPVSKFQS